MSLKGIFSLGANSAITGSNLAVFSTNSAVLAHRQAIVHCLVALGPRSFASGDDRGVISVWAVQAPRAGTESTADEGSDFGPSCWTLVRSLDHHRKSVTALVVLPEVVVRSENSTSSAVGAAAGRQQANQRDAAATAAVFRFHSLFSASIDRTIRWIH